MTIHTGIDWRRRDPGHVENLGIGYSAGTFSVQAANGSALGVRNQGYITIPSSTTPGVLKNIAITANQTFVDDTGTSTIAGNLFGFTTLDDMSSNDVPFFIYAVVNDSEDAISFMISRLAGMSTSPAAASIGKTGSAIADDDNDFFALSDPTVADYDSNPCFMIGSFRMRMKVTANDDWTVSALTDGDGIGRFNSYTMFSIPAAVLGTATGSLWRANGGTAPQFTTQDVDYWIDPTGYVKYSANFETNTVAGVGAVAAQLVIPLVGSTQGARQGSFLGEGPAAVGKRVYVCSEGGASAPHMAMIYIDSGGGGNLNNQDITMNVHMAGWYLPRVI